MTAALQVLLVEDSPADAKLIVLALRRSGQPIEVERVDTAEGMRAALASHSWDAIVSDWSMPKFSAAAALTVLKEKHLDVPFIIVSGTIGEDAAVEAMRAGAHDYVLKDRLSRLAPALERELRECSDRAARRRTEDGLRQQLRQAQKMEAVGRLAGGVAHDFNNMLSVILSYAEMLLQDLQPTDPIRVDIEEIDKAATRAAGLTRQLLMFSRQQVMEPKVLDPGEVLRNMDKMLKRILGEDVELVLVAPEGVGRVKVDPSNIEQVILNLVVNARDAMPTGGKLTIETADVVLDEAYVLNHVPAKIGRHVLIAVTDTGSGMDPETQAQIFEPFFTTKEVGKGTGLGLSTVFGIVQQSGGHVQVESEPNHGATFKVYLPRVDAEVDSLVPTEAPTTLRGTETLLLVEDEEQVRTIVLSILRQQGYEVVQAQNAADALVLCEKFPGKIDLIVTDVVMPHMSGPALAKRLAATRPGMKVLCMSGYTDDSVVRHGVIDSGVAFLQKPVTPAVLARKVREVLDAGLSPAAQTALPSGHT